MPVQNHSGGGRPEGEMQGAWCCYGVRALGRAGFWIYLAHIKPWTHQAVDTAGIGHIRQWTRRAFDTWGREHTGPLTHRAVDLAGRGHSEPRTRRYGLLSGKRKFRVTSVSYRRAPLVAVLSIVRPNESHRVVDKAGWLRA